MRLKWLVVQSGAAGAKLIKLTSGIGNGQLRAPSSSPPNDWPSIASGSRKFWHSVFPDSVHWPPASVEIMKNGAVRTGQLTRRVGLNWRRRSWPNQAHMLPASRLIDELLRLRSTSSSRSVRRRRNIIYKLINCCLLEVIVRATTLVDK